MRQLRAMFALSVASVLPSTSLAAGLLGSGLAKTMAQVGAGGGVSPVWKNWEDTVECFPQQVAYPTTTVEVSFLVATHPRVRVVGPGHSFNRFVCSEGLMLSTSKMNKVLSLDEEGQTVTVQAGIITRDLLQWLRERGWSLGVYSYYIDQSIGGAVATGTHGSSTTLGSLSSTVRSMMLVAANGTVLTVQEGMAGGEPDLWDAARTNVGFLGVVTELTLAVIPDRIVHRDSAFVAVEDALAEIGAAANDSTKVDQVHFFYFFKLREVLRTANKPPAKFMRTRPNLGTAISSVYYNSIKGTKLEGPYWALLVSMLRDPDTDKATRWLQTFLYMLSALPGNYHFSDSMPVQTTIVTETLQRAYGHYDQYEFSIPLPKAHGCFKAFMALVDSDPDYQNGFRVPACIRFVKEEDILISATRGGPRLFINIDNYHAYQQGGVSQSFERVKALMRSSTCDARVHYGKASVYSGLGGGWTSLDVAYARSTFPPEGPDMVSPFDRFLAIAKRMDPTGKFADTDHVFRAIEG